MNIPKEPKYSRPEIERRWLPIVEKLPNLDTLEAWYIQDNYLQDSRLRLRKMYVIGDESTMRYKICKKYGKTSDISEPIANIYLTKDEYEKFTSLDARILVKRKYNFPYKGNKFVISVFEGSELITVEAEFESEEQAASAEIPDFVGREVSADREYESATIAV